MFMRNSSKGLCTLALHIHSSLFCCSVTGNVIKTFPVEANLPLQEAKIMKLTSAADAFRSITNLPCLFCTVLQFEFGSSIKEINTSFCARNAIYHPRNSIFGLLCFVPFPVSK